MAGSRYAYVRDFELGDAALPHTYLVVRIDGRGFHRFSHAHGFAKPNDAPALELMNEAARAVLREFKGHITLAFGESDEYRYVVARAHVASSSTAHRRSTRGGRASLCRTLCRFSRAPTCSTGRRTCACHCRRLRRLTGGSSCTPAPRRCATTLHGARQTVRRTAHPAHINNLYNTTFWALVLQGGQTEREAHDTLKGTYSKDKHEILFSRFGINYDKLPALFRKGTTLVYAPVATPGRPAKAKPKTELRTLHVDLIQDAFWCAGPDAPSGEAKGAEAPAAGAAADGPAGTPDTPFYAEPRRLQCAGLGALVLSDRT